MSQLGAAARVSQNSFWGAIANFFGGSSHQSKIQNNFVVFIK